MWIFIALMFCVNTLRPNLSIGLGADIASTVSNTVVVDQIQQAQESERRQRTVAAKEEAAQAQKDQEKKEVKEAKEIDSQTKDGKIEKITEKLIEKIEEELGGKDASAKETAEATAKVDIGKIEEGETEEASAKQDTVSQIIQKTEAPIKKSLEKQNPLIGVSLPLNYDLVNDKKEIDLGSTIPLTGGVSMIGRDFKYGMSLIFNKINQAGGINGNRIRFYTFNDKNKVNESEINVNKMLKQYPTFFGLFGSDPLALMRDKLEKNEVAVFFPATGDPDFRKSKFAYTFHLRASLYHEISALITYAVKKRHTKKFGIFYEDSLFGDQGRILAEEILAEFKLKLNTKVSYPRNTVNIMSAVKEIVADKPDVILCISHNRATYNFIQKVVNGGLNNCLFLGCSELFPIQKIISESRGVELVLSSVVPNPFKSDLEIIKKYRSDMQKYFPNRELSTFSLEGYIASSIFTQALKVAKNNTTLGNIFSILENLKNVDFGGLQLNFSSKTRTLFDTVWINEGVDRDWSRFTLTEELRQKFESRAVSKNNA